MLRNIFLDILSKYTDDNAVAATRWKEIEKAYQAKGRHYHTLTHLENLLQQLQPYQAQCADWHAIVCAVAYHDMIYNVLRQDNEEKSAEFARKKLAALSMPQERIQLVVNLILATKKHEQASILDIDLFTDADLSVLGAPWETYQNYTLQIRKEYAIYPDLIYRPGRKKVLEHFLAKNAIYKTPEFKDRYEQQARANLQQEINTL